MLKLNQELTREQRDKRLAVAKDALARTVSGDYTFKRSNGYVRQKPGMWDKGDVRGFRTPAEKAVFDRHGESCRRKGDNGLYLYDLRAVVDTVAEVCDVCLMGGLLLSKARLYNEAELPDHAVGSVDRDRVSLILDSVFDRATLLLCEAAFEQSASASWRTANMEAASATEREIIDHVWLAARFGCAATRLAGLDSYTRESFTAGAKAVLLNLIANDGEFDPGHEPTFEVPEALQAELDAILALPKAK